MPWIKNIAIGRIRISDIQLELADQEPVWIDPEIYNRSNNLQQLVQSGALKIVGIHKGVPLKHEVEKKVRKAALPISSNFFPHGHAQVPKQKDLQGKRTEQLIKVLKKIIPEELRIEIQYNEFIPEKDFLEILNEQCKSLELIEKLYTNGMQIFVNGQDIRSTKIPNMTTTYIPNVDLKAIKPNIKANETVGRLTEAGDQLKKLKKNKTVDKKEKTNEQGKKSDSGS